MSQPSFRIGFELEGLVRAGYQSEFDRRLFAINPLINRGTDGSVDGYFTTRGRDFLGLFTSERTRANGIEIRTPVQTLSKGLELFEQILEYLAEQSAAGNFKTNVTCGLHVNLSEPSLDTEMKFLWWYAHLVHAFPEHEVLRMFRRTTNTYCQPLFTKGATLPEPGEVFSQVCRGFLGNRKYHSAANRVQRVEFRCLGNKDYHLKFDLLSRAIDAIIESARVGFEIANENRSSPFFETARSRDTFNYSTPVAAI